MDDEWCVDRDVVIAQDGAALGAGKGAENLGTTVSCVCGGDRGERASCDEVACEENELWGEVVGLMDDVLEKRRLGELIEVNIAELDDAIAVEWIGEVLDADGLMDDIEVVARDLG